jgi:hypothetical protein
LGIIGAAYALLLSETAYAFALNAYASFLILRTRE